MKAADWLLPADVLSEMLSPSTALSRVPSFLPIFKLAIVHKDITAELNVLLDKEAVAGLSLELSSDVTDPWSNEVQE